MHRQLPQTHSLKQHKWSTFQSQPSGVLASCFQHALRLRWTCQDVLSFLDTLWKNAILRSFGWKVQFLALVGLSSLFFNSCQPGASPRHWRLLCSFSNVPLSSEDQGHIYPTFINMVMFFEFFNLQLGKTLLYTASSFFKTYLNKGISLINYSCRRAQSTLIPRSGDPGPYKKAI